MSDAATQHGEGLPLLILGTHRFAPEVLDFARDAGFEVDLDVSRHVPDHDRTGTDGR